MERPSETMAPGGRDNSPDKFTPNKSPTMPSSAAALVAKKRRTNDGLAVASSAAEIGETSQPETKRKGRIDQIMHPNEFVVAMFKQHGCDSTVRKSTSVDRFKSPDEEQIEAYNQDVVTAVRKRDVQALRQMLQAGKCLQCCNRFGEGLMHMACRRGYLDIVRFLVLEAKCSLFVNDDYGRTPMHDACWSPKPNFKLMKFLIEQSPELLLMSDVRGHTPYSYARKEHWAEWILFLKEHRSLLRTTGSKKAVPKAEAVSIVG